MSFDLSDYRICFMKADEVPFRPNYATSSYSCLLTSCIGYFLRISKIDRTKRLVMTDFRAKGVLIKEAGNQKFKKFFTTT